MAKYYDVDDIIMEEELFYVVFQVGANGVGLLVPVQKQTMCDLLNITWTEAQCYEWFFIGFSVRSMQIEKGAKVELPFWLAQELHLRQAVSVNVPACFNQKTRKEIQADAACVDLRNRCPYFYELGCKVAPL
ncbi:GINS complex [Macleaya cordata]|uniref:GINS complex n=1 Tax=Macleaya cordata TaxID=56857 RepID=A0A200QR67_MACCD|nr:GINS complex [Macleaya cordata]